MADTEKLIWALQNGDMEEVKSRLPGNVNETLKNGRAALHYAADYGHADVVDYLISRGAGVNTPDVHGFSPLMTACMEGQISCVKVLLEKGADKDQKGPDGMSALEAAGDCEAIKALLK